MAVSSKLLLSCVRVRAPEAGGSGTVIFSQQVGTEKSSTFVLTNYHVIAKAIAFKPLWNNVLKRDIKTEILSTVEVHFFQYKWEQRTVGATAIVADVVAYDELEDLALLKLRNEETIYTATTLFPKGHEPQLRVGMPVLALGCGLGESPILTVGRLSLFGREIENKEYWLQTAPTIFGNSGGAVFLEDTEEFIGVPAMIAVSMMGFTPDVITHLSYIVPITRVYQFIDKQMFRFLYDHAFTEEGETKARETKRRDEELRITLKESRGEQEGGD